MKKWPIKKKHKKILETGSYLGVENGFLNMTLK